MNEEKLKTDENGKIEKLKLKIDELFYNKHKRDEMMNKISKNGFTVKYSDIPKYIIFSNSRYRILWNIMIYILIFYSILLIPLDIGFNKECFIQNYYLPYITLFHLLRDIIFIIDILLVFFTAIHDNKGQYSFDLKKIAFKYIYSTFIFDFIASFPLDIILKFDINNCGQTGVDDSKLTLFVGLLRILRLIELNNLIEKSNISYINYYRLIKLLFVYYYICHTIGSLFVGISSLCLSKPWSINLTTDSKRTINNFFLMYSYSILTGIVMILQTDFAFLLNAEKITVICLNVLNLVIGAYIFGYVSLILSKMENSNELLDDRLREKLDNVNEYLVFERIPENFRVKINDYFKFMFLRQRDLFYENNLFTGYNPFILILSKFEMWKSNYFSYDTLFIVDIISPMFFMKALMFMEGKIFIKEEIIVYEGENSTDLYFICNHSVCDVHCSGLHMNSLNQGQFFGETAIFLSSEKRTATVVSKTTGDVLLIPGEKYLKLLREFKNEMKFFREIADKFIRSTIHVMTPEMFSAISTKKGLQTKSLLKKNLYTDIITESDRDTYFKLFASQNPNAEDKYDRDGE